MINIKMQPADVQKLSPKITVIGVGGAGGNAVNNMIASNLEGCEFLVCNTDAQALSHSHSENRLQLGVNVTGGLGAGSKPEIGRAAAEESIDEIMQHLEGANMAFVTAGMGGGTGTGAAPVIAKACRERGILTVGVVTKPFHFEGSHRMRSAESGIEEIQDYVDTLIVIPNQNLFRIANEKTTFAEAFQMADSVLQAGVRGVTDLMVRPGLVNLDFADIRTAMLEMGKAMMGTGEASGEKRAIEAAESAINNPLLDDISMKGAHGVIINVTGGYDMTLFEADEACNRIRDEVDPDANIIFGATFDENLEGKMRVSIVATGIDKEVEMNRRSGGAHVKVNANGGGSIERAQPNTGAQNTAPKAQMPQQPQTPAGIPAGSPVTALTGVAAVRNITSPMPAAPQAAPQPQEPETEMFEQGEFTAPRPQGDVQMQNTALRGTRYKNSFIPPKPVEAPEQDMPARVPGSFHAAPSGAAPTPSANQPASSLNLNPPRLPTGQAKRSPSLFERITGSVQQHIDGRKEDETKMDAPTAQQRAAGPLSAPRAGGIPNSPQGSLNIDAPSAKPEGENGELDIPAFLRRQAN